MSEKLIIVGQGLPGARGTNHELAAGLLLPDTDFDMQLRVSFTDVYDAVNDENTRVVAALDNTKSGLVSDSWRQLTDPKRRLWIERIVRMSVTHDLIGSTALRLSELQDAGGLVRIRSHPHAIEQCAEWLERNLPLAELVDGKDTAGSVAAIMEEPSDRYLLAIAGPQTLHIYPGAISLARGIQGEANITEFALLSPNPSISPPVLDAEQETLLLVTQDHEDGAGDLLKLLMPLGDQGVNVTSLHSRQDGGWKTQRRFEFAMRVTGRVGRMLNADETPLDRALDSINKDGHTVRVLGSYGIFQAHPRI